MILLSRLCCGTVTVLHGRPYFLTWFETHTSTRDVADIHGETTFSTLLVIERKIFYVTYDTNIKILDVIHVCTQVWELTSIVLRYARFLKTKKIYYNHFIHL